MTFNVNKFMRQHKEIMEERKELLQRLAGYEAQKAQDVLVASQIACQPLHDQLAMQKAAIAARDELAANLQAEVERLASVESRLLDVLDEFDRKVQALTAERDEWQAKYEAQLPAVQVAEGKARDLQVLLDKHSARMNRKEKEAASAILNRQALSGARPGENRRR